MAILPYMAMAIMEGKVAISILPYMAISVGEKYINIKI
jgi:hypothetical protein